jgi:glyoxylase-like metal-dependent hydrolase (beta-lactamase superfamily II)
MKWKDGFEFEYGIAETVSPLVRRVVANNPSPYTGPGTSTFIVGRGDVAILDPGPALPEHIAAISRAVAGERVTHLLISHTHTDHSPATAGLQALTGGSSYAYGPAPLNLPSEIDGAFDSDFQPDRLLRDGDALSGSNWSLTTVHTPGHASGHLCFALAEEGILFTGDHVMGWSTSVIPPPDGDMLDYEQSLRKLLARNDRLYWSSHGAAIADPRKRVGELLAIREKRSRQVIARLAAGDRTIPEITAQLYPAIGSPLNFAARAMVHAQLLAFIRLGKVTTDASAGLGSAYQLI